MSSSPSALVPLSDSPADSLPALLRAQQAAFRSDMSPSRAVRLDRLKRLNQLIESHAQEFAAAISSDFGTRSLIEIRITETLVLQSGIRHAIRNLAHWMKARRVSTALAYRPGRSLIMRQPLGVVGIISPWNYPLQLALAPLIGAMAAGNRAMLKPSELTPAFSQALSSAIVKAFASDEVAVVTGDASLGKQFAALPFDHLVFTGSTAVGREVALAAANNLTPLTLELGGKSPAIIDASCNLEGVMDRIAWGKLINAGQTCIAPDYMLVPRGAVDRFVALLCASMARLYPKFRSNPDYSGIISERHLRRLRELIEDARGLGATVIEVEPAESSLAAAGRQLPPTLLLGVSEGMRVMSEEIFGPILPIIPYDTLAEALGYINRHERPLALYWFGQNSAARDQVLSGTIAGGVSINDTLLHIAQEGLPFGGVGASGQGHYHGEFGFRQFSKEKPVFIQSRFSGGGIIRPPYKPSIERVLSWLSRFT
ncbi:MAG TPA: coniferyl aldehyde dehydrogenase [Xanthobacteraceae bacterium]|jgi:coniferyl-aldehyde dehydrogenase